MRYILLAFILLFTACSDQPKPEDKLPITAFSVTSLKSAEDALNKINTNMEKGFSGVDAKITALSTQLQSASATMTLLDKIAIGFALACLAIAFYLRNGFMLCGSFTVTGCAIASLWVPYFIPLVLIACGLLIVLTFLALIYRIEQDLGHVKSLADLKQHLESSVKQLATTAETDAKKLLLALHDKISSLR